MMKHLCIMLLCVTLLAFVLFQPPVSMGDDRGNSPDNPIDMAGTMSGTLAAGEYCWYRFSTPHNAAGVVMSFYPVTFASAKGAGFDIGYQGGGIFGTEWIAIGEGTPLPDEPGLKYWRGDSAVARTYLAKAQNESPHTVDYAIAFTGDAFPPPSISFDPQNKQPSYGGWPVSKPAPTAVVKGSGPSAEKALAIEGDFTAGVLGPNANGWLSFRTFGSGRSTTVKMTVKPYVDNESDQALFKVWRYLKTPVGYTLTEVGRSSRGGNPPDTKSWRGGSDAGATYYLELINTTQETANWEIKIDNYYPYWKR
jgi:hypothetical protein